MSKRLVSLLLVLVLATCLLPLRASAGSLSHFYKIREYPDGRFTDVISGQWYERDIKTAYEYGLFNGTSPTTLSPGSNITLAETITLASSMHSTFHTGLSSFSKDITPWYQPYVDYALTNGLIPSPYPNYTANATRSDMAVIFANALPDEAITPINKIDDNAIPDVPVIYTYSAAVYKLYRAGILNGSGDAHAFNPNDNITRAEIAAIGARMVNSGSRVLFSISPKELTATEIAEKCSPAVFYIELYDSSGDAFASGSGFFISSDGLAVTNFHVIDGASSAKILATDGSVYDVAGVYDYNEDYDLALLQVSGSKFSYLEIGDLSAAVTGATVYAIGSPKGLDNTFTQGIISNASRRFNASPVNYIQIDAAVSSGSSGGALINTKGRVIGVTTAGIDNAQNINFAVPINLILELNMVNYEPLSTVTAQKPGLTVTASPSAVSVGQGEKATIVFSVNSYDFYDAFYTVSNESLISCSWGPWGNYQIPLTVTGLSAGTTSVLLELVDEDNIIIASTTVSVTVTGGGTATAYYQGYYPVPDWGAFTGTPLLYYISYPDGGISFYYRMSDITASSSVGVGEYISLLNSNDFFYYTGFTSDEGYPVNVYTNLGFDVYLGVATFGSDLCMRIMILPC